MKLATVCMVKNEESVIGRMIKSAAPITDLFVFTDTGSTDGTKKKIKETCKEVGLPYEIHDAEFIDFGVTRTQTVQNAIGKADYLLLLDADMTIEDKGFDKESLSKDGYQLYYTGQNRYAQMLLVNGHLDWKYYEKTHEYIYTDQIKTIGNLKSLMINHHIDGGNRKDKFERDRKLLEETIQENPKNRRAYFYLAETYRNMNKPHEAMENYRKRIELGGWKEEVYYSIYQLGRMLAQIKEYDQARITLMDAWEFRPQRLEALHALSIILRETKKFNTACLFLKKGLETNFPKDDVLFVEKPIYDFLLRFEYSINVYYAGNKKEALKQCNILLNQKDIPDNFYNQIVKNKQLIQSDMNREKELKKKNPKFNQKILFVSAFTKDTPYEQEVETLRDSLEKFGLSYIIYEIPNQGTWVRNTQEKVKYMFRALEDYKCPIVWVDADAEILKKPEYFKNVNNDIQFYQIKEWDDYLIGTLFLNYNLRVREFLTTWIYNCDINNLSAQKVFKNVIKQAKNLDVGNLPVEYIKIFDNELQKCDDPVIVHNQASRRFKKEIPRIEYVKNFENEEKQKYEQIAVIGNGPFESDLSEEIEKSFVVRCNNFKTGEQYRGIGEKTDINASSLYGPIVPRAKVPYAILGVHPISAEVGQYSDAKQMFWHWNDNRHELLGMGNNVLIYNEADKFFDVWKELADEIGGFPTTGIVAIALARYWSFKKIILSGFNFFTTEKTHYFMDDKVKPSSHHKVVAEKQIINRWIKNDKIKYVIDKEISRSFNDKLSIDDVMQKNDLYDG